MLRAHRLRHLGFAVGLVAALVPVAGRAMGQERAAPSLRVETDAEVPVRTLAATVDPLAAFFARYGVEVELAVADLHSIRLLPQLEVGEPDDALGLEVGYHLWPLAQGLEGLFLGPAVALSVTSPGRAVRVLGVLEVGYQLVWDGIVLAACVGLAADRDLTTQSAIRVRARVRLALGYAWF